MKPRRALGYPRVSSIQQTLGTSLKDQENSIRDYATRINVTLSHVYVEAESGIHEKTEKRDQMRALLADVREGDLVICDKLDRWSRDTEWMLKSVRELREKGVSFYAVSDQCDPSTRDGDMMLTMRGMMAKEEHRRIKERLVGTRNLLRAAGYYTDSNPPRGYTIQDRVLTVDAAGAAIVREVFAECARGHSIARIAEDHGLDRQVTFLMLRNRHYLGEVRDGRGGWLNGRHDPIITPAMWSRAREALESRRLGGVRPRVGETSTWVLRNIAHCAKCGARMSAAYAGPKGSRRRHYYRCFAKCGAKYVAVRVTEERACYAILERLAELREEISRGPVAPSSGTRALDVAEQRSRLTKQRERTLDLYVAGTLNKDDMQKRVDAIDSKLGKLDAEAPQPLSDKARRSALRTFEVMAKSWKKLGPKLRREIAENLARKALLSFDEAPVFEWRSVEEMVIEKG